MPRVLVDRNTVDLHYVKLEQRKSESLIQMGRLLFSMDSLGNSRINYKFQWSRTKKIMATTPSSSVQVD